MLLRSARKTPQKADNLNNVLPPARRGISWDLGGGTLYWWKSVAILAPSWIVSRIALDTHRGAYGGHALPACRPAARAIAPPHRVSLSPLHPLEFSQRSE